MKTELMKRWRVLDGRPARQRGAVRLATALLVAVMLASGSGSWTIVAAQDAVPFWGYVYANEPTTKTYTPGSNLQHTSTGDPISIERSYAGEYAVYFPVDHKAISNIQISAVGTVAAVCASAGWDYQDPSKPRLWVYCWDSTGEVVDTGFTVFVSGNVSVAPSAYLSWQQSNPELGQTYTPDPFFQFNSTNGENTVAKTDVGRYTVILPGLGSNPDGIVHITPGSTWATCVIEQWGAAVASPENLEVLVRCTDGDGTPSDISFGLVYFTSEAATTGTTGASYWSEPSHGTTYQYNTAGEAIVLTKSAVGKYSIRIPGVGIVDTQYGNAQVTAIADNGPIWCLASGTYDTPADVVLTVYCVDATATYVDADFIVMWTRG